MDSTGLKTPPNIYSEFILHSLILYSIYKVHLSRIWLSQNNACALFPTRKLIMTKIKLAVTKRSIILTEKKVTLLGIFLITINALPNIVDFRRLIRLHKRRP